MLENCKKICLQKSAQENSATSSCCQNNQNGFTRATLVNNGFGQALKTSDKQTIIKMVNKSLFSKYTVIKKRKLGTLTYFSSWVTQYGNEQYVIRSTRDIQLASECRIILPYKVRSSCCCQRSLTSQERSWVRISAQNPVKT